MQRRWFYRKCIECKGREEDVSTGIQNIRKREKETTFVLKREVVPTANDGQSEESGKAEDRERGENCGQLTSVGTVF